MDQSAGSHMFNLEERMSFSKELLRTIKEELQIILKDQSEPDVDNIMNFLIQKKHHSELENVSETLLEEYLQLMIDNRYLLELKEISSLPEGISESDLQDLNAFLAKKLYREISEDCAEALTIQHIVETSSFLASKNSNYKSISRSLIQTYLSGFFYAQLQKKLFQLPVRARRDAFSIEYFREIINEELEFILDLEHDDERNLADFVVCNLSKLVFFTKELHSKDSFTRELRKEVDKLCENPLFKRSSRINELLEIKIGEVSQEIKESPLIYSADMYGHLEESPKAIIEDLKGTPKGMMDSDNMMSFSPIGYVPSGEIDTLKETIMNHEIFIDKLREEHDIENKERDFQLQKAVAELEKEKKATCLSSSEIEKLKKAILDHEVLIDKLKEEHDIQNKEWNVQLQERITELEKEKQEACASSSEIERLKKTILDHEVFIDKLKEDHDVENKEKDVQLQKTVEELENEKKETTVSYSETEKLKQTIADYERTIAQLKESYDRGIQENTIQLQKRITELEREKQEACVSYSETEKLKQTIAEYERTIAQLKESYDRGIQENAIQLQKRITELEKEKQEARVSYSETEKLKQTIAEYERTIAQLKESYDRDNQENALELRRRIAELEREKQEPHGSYHEVEQLKETVIEYEEIIKRLRENIEREEEDEVVRLRERIDILQGEKDELYRNRTVLVETAKRYENIIRDFKDSLRGRGIDHQFLNSLFEEIERPQEKPKESKKEIYLLFGSFFFTFVLLLYFLGYIKLS